MPTIRYVDEFQKEFDKFCKKHNNFEKDMDRFEAVLNTSWPKLLPGIIKISNIGEKFCTCYKAREFRCKALNRGSKSGIRIIFTYDEKISEFIFIELQFKGTDDNHDHNRLMRYAIRKT